MPPEFFLDRGLGKNLARQLRGLDWRVHLIADHFADDAQGVADQDWIDYGLARGWTPLCKDGRIRGIEAERRPVVKHEAVLFYLDNQQLKIDEMVRRFHSSQEQIYRRIANGGPAIFAVRADGLRRTWP